MAPPPPSASSPEGKLLRAAVEGDAGKVKELLHDGVNNLNASAKDGLTSLMIASRLGYMEIVAQLVAAGANVHAVDDHGRTAFCWACAKQHNEIAQILLATYSDVNAANPLGNTPLHVACEFGLAEIVAMLLDEKNANVNVVNKLGQTPLHRGYHDATTAKRLIELKATVDACDHESKTPLHYASRMPDGAHAMQVLLDAGANVHAANQNGLQAIHFALQVDRFSRYKDLHHKLQVLAQYGATWDAKCDALASGGAEDQDNQPFLAPALGKCFQLWIDEQQQRLPLSSIPLELLLRGGISMDAYLSDLQANPSEVLYRSKICVIGPSCWGKTSLIQSLQASIPRLEHVDNRSIGIDLTSWAPLQEKQTPGMVKYKTHQVTFWDFAGQENYAASHALFFSKRTVFVVLVDLHSYAMALAQSRFVAGDDDELDVLMNDFVKHKIVKWLRLVFTRQPDAQFTLVATKADVIKHNAKRIERARVDLEKRLAKYMNVYVKELQREVSKRKAQKAEAAAAGDGGGKKTAPQRVASLDRLRYLMDSASRTMAPKTWLVVSCTTPAHVQDAKSKIAQLVIASDLSFPMPASYSRVLDAIYKMTHMLASLPRKDRVDKSFVLFDQLYEQLLHENHHISTVDKSTFREITRTLHDLGDILWYEDLLAASKGGGDVDAVLSQTVIVDPSLLIDFIRQVVDHNAADERILHATLLTLPFWRDLHETEQLTLALKKLLHHFHLAYPTGTQMEWDSDLIIPAYWSRKYLANVVPTPRPLCLSGSSSNIKTVVVDPTHRLVQWEYHFGFDLPDTVFEHVAVASYLSLVARTAQPYLIEYKPCRASLCRIWVERDAQGAYKLCVGAVASANANPRRLWKVFETAVGAVEVVLDAYPGLLFIRYAVDHCHHQVLESHHHQQQQQQCRRVRLADVVAELDDDSLVDCMDLWLPPSMLWYTTQRWNQQGHQYQRVFGGIAKET